MKIHHTEIKQIKTTFIEAHTDTVKRRFTDSYLIWTPQYYEQFSLSLGEIKPPYFLLIQPA